MLKSKFSVFAALAMLMSLFSVAAHAAMTVQPVILDLKMAGRDMGGQIRVQNTGTTPLPVEIRLVEAELLPDTVKASDRPTKSEEHTSELQSLMRISYAVFCLKKKKQHKNKQPPLTQTPTTIRNKSKHN